MTRSLFIFFFFFFSLRLTIYKKCGKVWHHKFHIVTVTWWDVTMSYHMIKSHEECGKIVHRLCSSCISSVQEINEDFIEFFLSTQTWRVIKSSRPSHYMYQFILSMAHSPFFVKAQSMWLPAIVKVKWR